MRTQHLLALAAALVAAPLGACRDEAEPEPELPSVPAAFPHLLLPPSGTLVARAGSEDALQLIFTSTVAPARVAAYYRRTLSQAPWRLVGDETSDSTSVLYAETGGRPLWVRVAPGPDGAGTRIELTGAVAAEGTDTAAAAAPAAPGSTSSDSARAR